MTITTAQYPSSVVWTSSGTSLRDMFFQVCIGIEALPCANHTWRRHQQPSNILGSQFVTYCDGFSYPVPVSKNPLAQFTTPVSIEYSLVERACKALTLAQSLGVNGFFMEVPPQKKSEEKKRQYLR